MLKQIALSNNYKSLIGKKIKYTRNHSNVLEQNKVYTIESIKQTKKNAYVTLKEVKTSFDIPYNTDLFELMEPTKQPKQRKLIKLSLLFIMMVSLFTSNHAFAATKSNTTYHYKQMYLTLPHTIRTSYNFKSILAHPRTNKIVNHIKVSKSYKTPKTHIVKASKIAHHTTKVPTYHYHAVKFKTIKITHVNYHSTFHPTKIKTISYHRHKI